MTSTTVKVSTELRDRINREAQARGTTAASLIELMLDDYVRRQRMEAFGAAIRGADQAYWDEFHDWDVALGDGSSDE
ncbi:MAG: toxin-antitoxin system protein [Ancrocorticia populi]|uniref:Toxin-antitoxin system protein n=1 Tax=Ancrocorticia populi TaxID=2175228 RepID=A0A2V1K730_9ACTO|nr:CopG family transcriptional regulator [Ancrocorticia populi]MDN6486873.1 ribbon-helix-helix domain-containing protein [Ancrocorticia sp.]PWF27268.1 toxin-antitoxin system protein [Ancrocorticia populi]